jgi:hypothetical protein
LEARNRREKKFRFDVIEHKRKKILLRRSDRCKRALTPIEPSEKAFAERQEES